MEIFFIGHYGWCSLFLIQKMKRFHHYATHLDSLLEVLKKPEYQEAGFCGILIRSPDKKHAALVRSSHEDIYSALQQYTSVTKMGLSWKKGRLVQNLNFSVKRKK